MLKLDTEVWEELLALLGRDPEERAFLGEVLELWCRAHDVQGAALYLDSAAGLRREVTAGGSSFPLVLTRPLGLPIAAIDLPGGVLLYAGPALPGAPLDAPTVLLAAGTRIKRLQQQLKEQRFQVSFRGVEQQALYDVGLAIASTLDLEKLSEEILMWAVSLLDARRGALYLLADDHYQLSRALGGEAHPRFAVEEPAVADLLAGLPIAADSLLPGARHLLGAPIEIEGSRRGLLIVADKESRKGVGPFADSDHRTLLLFANQAAIALENARLHRQALEKERLEREMELAAEIQRQILPKGTPQVPGFEVTGWNRPARQVGGDYYDLRGLPGDRLLLAVGDVSGKGMPAALMVSTLHSALRLLLDSIELGPQFLDRVNRHILESSASNKFITLLIAELDPATAELRFLNAGHNPGILLRASGEVRELTAGGLPLGLLPGVSFRAESLVMGPGDLLCLYSDGITEATSPDEEEFRLDRLVTLLEERRQQALPQIVEAIEQATSEFACGLPQQDDQTVVLLRRRA